MKRRVFSCLFAAAFALSAADPVIYFSFDKTTRADYGGTGPTATVAGMKEASGVKPRLLRLKVKGKAPSPDTFLQPGLSGKAFPIGTQKDGAILSLLYYPTPRITQDGSVSFWIKPVDWDGSDKREFRNFVSFQDGVHVYKNRDSNNLIVFCGHLDKGGSRVECSILSWKKGEWHHIGVTWSSKTLALYIDGRLKKMVKIKKELPKDFERFFLGDYWMGNPGQTLLDEVRIFDKTLDGKEMAAEFIRMSEKLAASRGAPLQIAVSGKKNVKTDGIIEAGEYAAAVGGMRDITKKNIYASTQATCRFAWDNENLYVAVTSPERKHVANLTGRDSAVYTEDSVELYLKTATDLYQFVVNPASTILDGKNGNFSWNAEGFRTKSSFKNGLWHWEAAVPWKEIGVTAKPGMRLHFNLARNYADTKESTQLAPCRRGRGYGDVPSFAEMILLEQCPSFELADFGDLSHSKIDANIKVNTTKEEKVRLRLNVDSSMFPLNLERNLTAEADKPLSVRIKRNIPNNNTLFCQLEIPEKKLVLYRTNLDYDEPEAMRKWYIYTDLKKAELVFVMRVAALNGGKTKMKLDFVTPDKKVAKSMTVELADNLPVVEARFPLKGLDAGRYFLDYTLMDASGKKYFSDREEYEYFKNGAYWDNFAGGTEETVPTPWTAVTAKGNEFQCWGRKAVFGGNGIVSSMLSQEKELLSRPVALKLNGKTVAFKAEKVSVTPVKATFRLKPLDSKIPLTMDVTAEFDGFCYFTGKIAPNSEIQSLVLEIPMARKYADAFDDCASPHYKNSLRKNASFFVNLYTVPFFWCGGDEIGMMGGVATHRGWYVKNKSRSMNIKADDKEVLLTLPVVDTKLRTKAAVRSFSFYLNPTPVRPLRKMFPVLVERENIINGGVSSRFYNYNHPGYFDTFWKWAEWRAKDDNRTPIDKMQFLPYNAPKGASPMSPAWNYYCTDWVNPPPALGEYSGDQIDMKARKSRNWSAFTYGCLNSKSFFDHQMQCVRNVLDGKQWKQFDVKHLYFDLSWPKPCGNAQHGCMWKDEFGDTVRDNDLLPLRTYYIRARRMLQKKSPDGFIYGHIYSTRTPADNFFDNASAGEMYDQKVCKNVNYYDVLTPETMRIAYGTRVNETNIALGPQFLRSLQCFAPDRVKIWHPLKKEFDRPIRHFIAYTVSFGLYEWEHFWTTGERLPPKGKGHIDIWYNHYNQLGADRTFRRIENIVPGTDRVFGSIYTGNGHKMLIVLNDTDTEKEFTVAVPWEDVPSMKDIFNGADYPVQKKSIRMKLAPRDSAFLFR